jgi:tetratricopeptide (TPR) repeat protein
MYVRYTVVAATAALLATTTVFAQQGARTVQQDFEAAAALDEGADPAAALQAWQALDVRTASNPRSHAIVLVRKSRALMRLHRRDEAIDAARAGLAALPTADPTLREDRFDALTTIGNVAESTLDYAGAAEAYRQADALAQAPVEKLAAELALIHVETFTDPAAAARDVARLDGFIASIKTDKVVLGEVAMRKAVLALNQGDLPAARTWSAAAVDDFGGLTNRVDLRDVSARSTAGIAALLSGNKDEARRFMAMTGAGRVGGDGFTRGAQMFAPDCGGEEGLKPDDFAVVVFSIADDGSVSDAAPIYAEGGGNVALEFARAAKAWSWTPEQVSKLPAFYRYNARVEMRCSVGFERPSIDKLERAEATAWLKAGGVDLPEEREGADAASVGAQRQALARAEAADPNSLASFAALYQLMQNSVVGREETNGFAARALAIAKAKGAPPVVQLGTDVLKRATASADDSRGDLRRAIAPLLTDPAYNTDPTARATARIVYAGLEKSDKVKIEVLRQVADDQGLAANDPLKVHALIRIASLEQQAGDTAAARAAFERSGLAANQCAIIDAPPRLVSAGGTYPQEAREWGFDGWTVTQFDVAADGKVTGESAILAYPPFVFTDAGTKTVAGARYSKTYRPDGGIGCGARTQGVSFKHG